jgi:lipopolysaccharide export LptBFGC system permease protein LptF
VYCRDTYQEEKRRLIVKPVTTIVVILLVAISIAHLLRLILQVNVVANGVNIPIWLSILGCIVPAVLALMLCRENRK